MDANHSALMDKIVEKLKSVYDPEIPVDIYELGLIYDVVLKKIRVSMDMTLQPSLPCCRIITYGSQKSSGRYC